MTDRLDDDYDPTGDGFTDQYAAGTDQAIAYLHRHHSSHEVPGVVLSWLRSGDPRVATVGAARKLVAEAWIGRNHLMPCNVDEIDWVEMFEECCPPIIDSGCTVPEVPFDVTRAGHPQGMSWTLDPGVADMFAKEGRPVYAATVTDFDDVLGVFGARDESEIVLRPDGGWVDTVRLVRAAIE